jgi:tRNA A37 threonylcarbamoyladenosine dehydratase
MQNQSPDLKKQTPKEIAEDNYTLHRRFDRMGRLIGDQKMKKLFNTHVMVLGLGGVGSWAAEAIARSGVGKITLVDFDEICITNSNRQLHAITGMVGEKKAYVMAARLKKINPQCQVIGLAEFYSQENSSELLVLRPDFIIDAIDNLTAKSFLLSEVRRLKIPTITSTGASARLDPLQIKLVDLAETHTDPMAHQLRKILRQKYSFPEKGEFGIPCVFSSEIPTDPYELTYDNGEGFRCVCPHAENRPHSCDKRNVIYGNAGFVTGAFGLAMGSWVVRKALDQDSNSGESWEQ